VLGLDIVAQQYTFLYFVVPYNIWAAVSINILSKEEDNLEKQEEAGKYPLVDKAYYVDTIAYKIDNSAECLNDVD